MTTLKAMWQRDAKTAQADRRIVELEDALKPFVAIASEYRRRSSEIDHSTLVQVTLGSCLRAEAAFSPHNRTEK